MAHDPNRPTWEQPASKRNPTRLYQHSHTVLDHELAAIRELIRDRRYVDAIARIDAIRTR